MKGYKAFNSDMTCRGFKYEIGKSYELPEDQTLETCKCGFHFCKNPIDVFGYYPMDGNTLIAEVEATGTILQEGTKYVTDKITILKEFTMDQLKDLIRSGCYNSGHDNSGNYNSGYRNSGSSNSGNYNSGDFNSENYNSGNYNSGNGNRGNYNSGDFNSGNYNSGNYNSEDFNSGNFNSGSSNTGSCNSGDYNSGHYNSGSSNTGSYNSGDYNSGNYNSGNYNVGNYNSGNYNSGIFNSTEQNMMAFNRPTGIKYSEFMRSLNYRFSHLCKRISTHNIRSDDIERIKALPNFDYDIFKQITGIDLNEVEGGTKWE